MKKIHIIKSNYEFNDILKEIIPIKSKNFNIFLKKENIESYFFGFVVGKKIGNAVVRNKIKRRMKNILKDYQYKIGFKCVIMAKRDISDSNFEEIKEELLLLLKRIDIFL